MKQKVFEGGKCRLCSGILFRVETKPKNNKAWRRKAYHFGAYLKCPNCGAMFMLNETRYKAEPFKETNATLF